MRLTERWLISVCFYLNTHTAGVSSVFVCEGIYLLGCARRNWCVKHDVIGSALIVLGTKEKWTSPLFPVLSITHKIALCFQAHVVNSLLMHTVTGEWIWQLTFPAVISLFLMACWCLGIKTPEMKMIRDISVSARDWDDGDWKKFKWNL